MMQVIFDIRLLLGFERSWGFFVDQNAVKWWHILIILSGGVVLESAT